MIPDHTRHVIVKVFDDPHLNPVVVSTRPLNDTKNAARVEKNHQLLVNRAYTRISIHHR
jgi:hypothetical protein